MTKLERIDARDKAVRRVKKMRAVRRHLEEGCSLAEACRRENIARRTVMGWIRRYADVRFEYREARVMQAELQSDRLLEIAEEARTTTASGKLQGMRLEADILKFTAMKLLPRAYGGFPDVAADQRLVVNVNFDKPKETPRAAIAAPQLASDDVDYESPMPANLENDNER